MGNDLKIQSVVELDFLTSRLPELEQALEDANGRERLARKEVESARRLYMAGADQLGRVTAALTKLDTVLLDREEIAWALARAERDIESAKIEVHIENQPEALETRPGN